MAPTFSIITGSWNNGRYLRSVIDSVLSQSFEDWEHIIVDDCSTDDSWDILADVHDPRIRVVRHPENRGGAATYNTGLSMAEGRYIANLDSDDAYHPDFLLKHKEHFDADPSLSISHCHVHEIDEHDQPCDEGGYREWFNGPRDLNDPQSWIWHNHLCHGAAVITRAAHEVVGPMRPEFIYTPDWDLWIRCLAAGFRFGVLPQELILARVHEANISKAPDRRLCLEYARTSAETLNPFLVSTGRVELAEINVQLFFDRPEFRDEEPEFAQALMAILLGADTEGSLVARGVRRLGLKQAFLAQQAANAAQRDADTIRALQESVARLEDGINGLQDTIASLQAQLAQTQDQAQTLREDLDRIRQQRVYRMASRARRALGGDSN